MESWRERLRRLGYFNLILDRDNSTLINENAVLPAHSQVIRPLLKLALECRVYGVTAGTAAAKLAASISRPHQQVLLLDLRQELVTGYERFWNAKGERGSVTIVTPGGTDVFFPILDCCSIAHLHNGTGPVVALNSRSAVQFCLRTAQRADVVCWMVCRTNGIEYLHVFAREPTLLGLYEYAREHCPGSPRYEPG